MKKFVSSLVILAMITTVFLTGTLVAVANSGTISIELDVTTAEVGDLISATVRAQNFVPTSGIHFGIHFNPEVVQIIDSDGYLVISEVKTAAQVRSGNAGLTPGQALSNDLDADYNPIFWNGSIFENQSYTEINNYDGLVRLLLANAGNPRGIVNETLITVNFIVIGEGDAEIRFSLQGDNVYDATTPYGPMYIGVPADPALGGSVPQFPQTQVPTLIIGEGDEDFEPPAEQEPDLDEDVEFTTITIRPPATESDTIEYTLSSRLLENALSRAFGETENGMFIRVETDNHINTLILRMRVSDAIMMFQNGVFLTEFSTLLGRIGFEHFDVFLNMEANSQYVIATISADYGSVTIDGVPMIQGGPVAQVETPADALGHWAENYIRFVVQNAIMVGFPDGTFRPNGSITRAEFSTAFARLLGLSNGSANFADTDEHWARGYIAAMADSGIVGGVGDGAFAPDAPITREQIAAIISRAMNNEQLTINSDGEIFASENPIEFGDSAQISDWAQSAVFAVRAAGIMQGDAAGNFNPLNGATRAEIAAVLARVSR